MAVALGALALACGDSRTGGGDGSVARDDAGARDGSTSVDGGAPGDAGAVSDAARPSDGGGPALSFCQLGCTTGADCSTPSAAFDEDNYRCEVGVCRYTGCNDDDECRATFASERYVCRDPGTGLRSCLLGCTSAADCSTGTAAFDADNYRCTDGVCIYEGCNEDVECTATFGAGYGCRDAEPPSTPLPLPAARRNCVRLCAAASDCATDSGAFSADNYACRAGACVWLGCGSDVECRATLSSDAYVCR